MKERTTEYKYNVLTSVKLVFVFQIKMYCPFCGFQWPALPRFCSSCGRDVSFVIENAPRTAGDDQVSCQTVPRGNILLLISLYTVLSIQL